MKIVQFNGSFDPIIKSDIELIISYHKCGYQVYLNHQLPNERSKAVLKESLKRLSYIIYGEAVTYDKIEVIKPCLIDECLFAKLTYNALKLVQDRAYYYDIVLAAKMSKKRFEHSLRVALFAEKLAIRYHLNPSRAYLMGLVHDVTKELDSETELLWMKANYESKVNIAKALYHQYTAEYYLINNFRINDKKILGAIKNHTSGEAIDCYAMILYVADKLEPGRNYDCVALTELVYKNLYQGFKAVKAVKKDYWSWEGNKND